MTSNLLYCIGDGDNVRKKIERLLFKEKLKELSKYSKKLIEAMVSLRNIAESNFDAEIVYSGGDDIFFTVKICNYNSSLVERLILEFEKITNGEISFGSGYTIEEAYINLRKAKLNDKSEYCFPKKLEENEKMLHLAKW